MVAVLIGPTTKTTTIVLKFGLYRKTIAYTLREQLGIVMMYSYNYSPQLPPVMYSLRAHKRFICE
jgi:hypothetical protein